MFSFSSKHEKGQGLVEYALILVLVAIVVIGALMILGPIIGNSFSTINNSLSSVASGGGSPSCPVGWSCGTVSCSLNTAYVACGPGTHAGCNGGAPGCWLP